MPSLVDVVSATSSASALSRAAYAARRCVMSAIICSKYMLPRPERAHSSSTCPATPTAGAGSGPHVPEFR